ncbi:MAG: class I SAM-dependent methyltransferase [Acidobacteriota bacterium]
MKRPTEQAEDIYSDYDRFAWFYNRHWGEEFSVPVLEIFRFILFPHLERGSHILDLCCGTGQLAAGLIDRGYSVTGIDGSREMLVLARINAPEAELIRADARAFELPSIFAAVVSTFDSLNHILSIEELAVVFANVRRILKRDGVFVFDLNTEDEFETGNRESMFDIVEDDHACVVRSRYDTSTRMKYYDVTMFTLEGEKWRRGDLTLRQRYYSAKEIVDCLTEAGFDRISVHDANQEFKLSLSEGRAFFVAHNS